MKKVTKVIEIDGQKVSAEVKVYPYQELEDDSITVRITWGNRGGGDGHKKEYERRKKANPDMSHLAVSVPGMPDTSDLNRLRKCGCYGCQEKLSSLLTNWRLWYSEEKLQYHKKFNCKEWDTHYE